MDVFKPKGIMSFLVTLRMLSHLSETFSSTSSSVCKIVSNSLCSVNSAPVFLFFGSGDGGSGGLISFLLTAYNFLACCFQNLKPANEEFVQQEYNTTWTSNHHRFKAYVMFICICNVICTVLQATMDLFYRFTRYWSYICQLVNKTKLVNIERKQENRYRTFGTLGLHQLLRQVMVYSCLNTWRGPMGPKHPVLTLLLTFYTHKFCFIDWTYCSLGNFCVQKFSCKTFLYGNIFMVWAKHENILMKIYTR